MGYLPINDTVGGHHTYCVKDNTISPSIVIRSICIFARVKQMYIHLVNFEEKCRRSKNQTRLYIVFEKIYYNFATRRISTSLDGSGLHHKHKYE